MLKKLENKMRKVLGPKTISPIAKPKKMGPVRSAVTKVALNPKVQKVNNTVNKITAPNTPIGYLPSRSIAAGKSIGDFAVRDPLSKISTKQKPAQYAKQAVSVLAKDKGIQDVVKKSTGVGSYLGTAASLGNTVNKGLGKQAVSKTTRELPKKTTKAAAQRLEKSRVAKLEKTRIKEAAKSLERKYKAQDNYYFEQRKALRLK